MAVRACLPVTPRSGMVVAPADRNVPRAGSSSDVCILTDRVKLVQHMINVTALVAAAKARQPWLNLSQCANLAPAGTGSGTLYALLKRYSRHAHHIHDRLTAELTGRGAHCLFITVRDPVHRLVSGWKLEGIPIHRNAYLRFAAPHSNGSLARFVDAFSNATDTDHQAVVRYWAHSVGRNGLLDRAGKEWGHGQVGSQFLKSQASYLHQVPPDGVTVHFLCTEQLANGAANLLAGQGLDGDADHIPHEHVRAYAVPATAAAQAPLALSAAQERVVRDDMFPWDTQLHRIVCGSHS